MIIKSADDKEHQIATLKALQLRPDASADIKKRIEQEIKNINAGAKGEREAAYEMEFHYGTSKNWMLIHDLRIECEGRVAQIDHLAINRLLEIWVCESKHFSEGLAINEHGECAAFYNNKPYGVASPFEQNRKHIAVLESVFKSGMVKLPTRLGFNIKPSINSLILVSKNARISRPKVKIEGIDTIIKNDQFQNKINQSIDAEMNPLGLAKLISSETLEQFAYQLAAVHHPIEFNWHAKFGLPQESLEAQPIKQVEVQVDQAKPKHAASESTIEATADKPKKKLICHSCNEPVAYAVAKFCWFNKPKFGGNVFCMECQKKV
jgi:hypothetical protein